MLAALRFRLALAGVVSEPACGPLGHFSACEPAPSGRVLCSGWNLSIVRLWEYVLGRRIHLENCPPKSAFANGRPRSLPLTGSWVGGGWVWREAREWSMPLCV